MTKNDVDEKAPVTIKKYANRRLYNTATSSYVTLDYLGRMVKDGIDFVVYDAKTGEDITRSVLTQIIVEEEAKGQHLLPISFLRQIIALYGDNLQWMVPNYLEEAMKSFNQNQERMRQYFQQTMTGMFPFGPLEQMSKQQLGMVERAMRMFSPFPENEEPLHSFSKRDARPAEPNQATDSDGLPDVEQIEQLQRKLADLQAELAKQKALSDGNS